MTPAYAELLRQRDANRHAAIVRGEDGALHIRRFATARDAMEASSTRPDFAEPAPLPIHQGPRQRRREWKLSAAARELGICARTLKRYVPYLQHRQPSPNVTYIPGEELNLIKRHGLHGVAAMRRGGIAK